MSITGELVGITTATRPALPIDQTRLPTHASRFAFSSAQLGCQLFFQKGAQDGPDGPESCGFGLCLHFLEDAFAFLSL